MASKARVVVFGGTGFVGSAIAREAVRRGLAVTSVTRGGAPPAHVASQEWSNEVQWKQGDALEPDSFKQHLEGAAAVITAVGCLPLPSLTHDEVVRANGETNVMPGKMAKEAGVPRLVMVGASIPSFVPGMSFGMNTSKGLFTAGYKVGKEQAEAYAKEFADPATGAGAVVLKPGGVSGTRYVGTTPLPLWMAMSPVSMLLRNFPLDAVAELSPTPVENLARAAVTAATSGDYAGAFTVIENLNIIRDFNTATDDDK
mmetsp:Transcript_35692/g.87835  ORF Transcript_35692/g.87835 Transcript_35692/m.87835 type:complete len:257 (-) Transcript_35692:238-1008(-)|eukprot:CAMPEP_0197591216 /NCGR_PEP_ID=MMETSP1326-20131121/12943_1 /TAXON_ID=1155430 /ORGANISM="Genus nov. species nov., Strain RCC2288" /LENGTH=256 /DNA_ID=CAMNT_0043156603 /DNA_START=226 /DNA_END=996 /DNA_ORIENTATION=-